MKSHNEMVNSIIEEVINAYNMEMDHGHPSRTKEVSEGDLEELLSFLENLKEKES